MKEAYSCSIVIPAQAGIQASFMTKNVSIHKKYHPDFSFHLLHGN